jgi:hypothetical protein
VVYVLKDGDINNFFYTFYDPRHILFTDIKDYSLVVLVIVPEIPNFYVF